MTFSQAILLGIVQGLTEFLPISSSGHLALFQSLFENFSQPGLLFDIILHMGSLFAVFVYFRKQISALIAAFFGIFIGPFKINYFENKNLLWGVIIATVPTGLIGYALKDYAEAIFEKPVIIGYMLIITSILLYFTGKNELRGRGNITPFAAVIVGIVQGIAVFPGISRSGATIFAGLKAGLSREKAAEFSFLVSIPAVIGATILEAEHLPGLTFAEIQIYALGMAAAFLSGLLAIALMMSLVKRAKLDIFALYCLVAGICAIMWL